MSTLQGNSANKFKFLRYWNWHELCTSSRFYSDHDIILAGLGEGTFLQWLHDIRTTGGNQIKIMKVCTTALKEFHKRWCGSDSFMLEMGKNTESTFRHQSKEWKLGIQVPSFSSPAPFPLLATVFSVCVWVWDVSLQLSWNVTCLMLGVWKAQSFAVLGFPGTTAMQTAVTALLLWCLHARAWWAYQRFPVCQIARSWFIMEGAEKESSDISADTALHSRHPS